PPPSADWALFLDIDGTLLDYAPHFQAVRAGPVVQQLLGRLLGASGGALALVSGRSVEDIDRLFAPLRLPLAGQHGTERRAADGTIHRHTPPLDRLGEAAAEMVRLTAAHSALAFENKGMTLAMHYRRAPELHDEVAAGMRRIAARAGEDFELQAGKFVFELKPSGKNKGGAIAEFLAEAPFAGRTPVFIGDDLTDEDGFAVVNRARGHSVKVGPGETCAPWRLADPAAVRAWLADWANNVSREAGAHP
ncbi:MAG: trehalose-phosphatase, partial [Usitatibacter sp.]